MEGVFFIHLSAFFSTILKPFAVVPFLNSTSIVLDYIIIRIHVLVMELCYYNWYKREMIPWGFWHGHGDAIGNAQE